MKYLFFVLTVLSFVSANAQTLKKSDTITVFMIDTGTASIPELTPYLQSTEKDIHGHGTHIAGILVYGPDLKSKPCKKLKIISCSYWNKNNTYNASLECFKKALALKPSILVYAGGGLDEEKGETQAVKELLDGGTVVVAAAGNTHAKSPWFPAQSDKRVLAVESLDRAGARLPSSNFGNVKELGKDVLSFSPTGDKVTMTGTSQATAVLAHKIIQTNCKE